MAVLDGIRVVDLTSYIQGPAATLELADMGAEVVKIEPPEGDPLRRFGAAKDGFSPAFEALNRNKRSLALDLRNDRAIEAVHRLVDGADVLVVNFRQKVLTRLGLDYATLADRLPRLIHVTATAYGVDGPDAAEPAFDIVAGGRSGLLIATGRSEGEPRRPLSPSGDLLAAKDTVSAIALALFGRERTGRGQRVVTSLLASQVAFQRIGFTAWLARDELIDVGHRDGMALSTWYRTLDDRWIVISLLHPRFFPVLCEAIGRPDLASDPTLGDPTRWAASDAALRETLAAEFAKRTRDDWVRILREAQLPGGPVLDLPEVVEDEQVLAQEILVEYDHPARGRMRGIGPAAQLRGDPPERFEAPREVGADTTAVLAEAGYSAERIRALLDEGAAFDPATAAGGRDQADGAGPG